MTSAFERLPYEAIDDIAARLLFNSKEDLRQLQLTSKRCQSIAEKHLFKKLTVSAKVIANIHDKVFLRDPKRYSYVKTLSFGGVTFLALGDDFFDKFCNIERLDYFCYSLMLSYVSWWKYCSKTFTPERCKLKEIQVTQNITADHAADFLKTLQNHSQTLEKVDLEGIHGSVLSLFAEDGGDSFSFPRLKSLSLTWEGTKLQELCALIDKCPSLERITVTLSRDGIDLPWTPTTQHKGLMKKITIISPSPNITNMSAYLAAKFPSVQEWYIGGFTLFENFEESDAIPFEKLADPLHLAMKSRKVKLEVFTRYSSIAKVLNFLGKYGAARSITINYDCPSFDTTDDILDSYGSGSGWRGCAYMSDDDSSDSSDNDSSEPPDGDDSDPFIMKLKYPRAKNATIGPATFMFPKGSFAHFTFLEQFGNLLRELKMEMPAYNNYAFEEEDDDHYDGLSYGDNWKQGGGLSHVFDTCLALTSLEYHATALEDISPGGKISKSLKKLTLVCDKISESAFQGLSYAMPSIESLTIKCGSNRQMSYSYDNQSEGILIDMPDTRIGKLVLRKTRGLQWSENILLRITLTSKKESKYYSQKCIGGKIEAMHSISQEEYDSYGKASHLQITISCRSIKCLEYYYCKSSLPVFRYYIRRVAQR